jgi:BirA family transcriptional regulator, biotin operon repressor / biotin---[acetyl-CoA-carboxylase] ligase
LSTIAKPIGSPFIELRSVESTNNYAMALVHDRVAQHGTCVFAHEQTKGKGQRQNTWISAPDQNITMSIIVAPYELAPSQQFSLSMAAVLGVYHFFNHYALSEVSVKWPNDLYWRDRKAGGILIENSMQGNAWQWSVIGIGLNINQTDFKQLNNRAVSLKQITGKTFNTIELAKELAGYVQRSMEVLVRNEKEIRKQYRAVLYKLNESVHFRQGSRSFTGTVADVTPTGELVVQSPLDERFGIGEVEWIVE